MKFARLTSRLAVGGVTAALATAGLVGVTGTSASAAPVSTTYTCATPAGSITVPVSVDVKLLPASAPAGFPVPAGLLGFDSTATIDGATQGILDTFGVTGAKSDDFGTTFGSSVAKAPVTWTKPAAADGSGNWVYTGKGANAAFTLPKAGTYTVGMPKSFTLVTTGGATPITATCTTAAVPATIGSITLSKQASETKVKAAKKAKHGSVVSVKIKVTNEYSKTGGVLPTGKVLIKDGSKTIGKGKLKKGKVTIKVKSLSVGTHDLVAKYKGDDFTNKSKSKKLTVTITK